MDECARMNCDKTAVALLTFSPPDAKAWLYDLDKPDPSGGIALCRKHANATVVPMSWQLVDARDPAWPGQLGEQPVVQAMAAASAEELLSSVSADELAETAVVAETVEAPTSTERPEPDMFGEIDAASPSPSTGAELPSDAASIEEEFAALGSELPVTPRPYAEPQLATARAGGRSNPSNDRPDPSLFELPLSDIPAVTPHPKYS